MNESHFHGFGDEMVVGFGLTILVAIGAMGVAVLCGLLGAGGKLSRNAALRALAAVYTTVVRGIPELVLIIVLYYGLPTLAQAAVAGFAPDYRLNFPPFATGVTVLGIIYGAFATEIFRGAFLAVPRGELEAGRAFGMSPIRVFWRIHLPQIWRYALPGLGNVWMVLVKATALVSVIQLQELMFWSKRAGESTREPFFFLLMAGCAYLLLTFASERVLAILERRASTGVRPAVRGTI